MGKKMKWTLKTRSLKGCMCAYSLHIQIVSICMKNKSWEVFSTVLFQCLSYYLDILMKRDMLCLLFRHLSTNLRCYIACYQET